jgi:hypothetical protein
MTLQALILELASQSTRPDPSQAIWVTSCPDPVGRNYAEALAQAIVKLENSFNVSPVEESKHTFLGGTADVWDIVSQSKIISWADCLIKLSWG